MVLPTLNEVYEFSEKFQTSRIRHEQKKRNEMTISKVPKPLDIAPYISYIDSEPIHRIKKSIINIQC